MNVQSIIKISYTNSEIILFKINYVKDCKYVDYNYTIFLLMIEIILSNIILYKMKGEENF